MPKHYQRHHAAQAVQYSGRRHAQDPQPHNVRRAADDKQRRDGGNGDDGRPGQHVEAPPRVGAQGPVKPLLLDQAESAHCKLQIRRPAPDGGDDGKDDPSLDVAGVVEGVVQGDGDDRGIDKGEEGKQKQAPATSAVVPRERELGQQKRVGVVVFLEGSSAAGVLGARGGAGVVVCRGGRAESVGEAASRGLVEGG